jgi:hypothetical protein
MINRIDTTVIKNRLHTYHDFLRLCIVRGLDSSLCRRSALQI